MASDDHVDRRTLAGYLGVTEKSITSWIKQRPEFPSRVRGRNRTFPLGKCIRWYVNFKLEEQSNRQRKQKTDDKNGPDTPAYRKALADAELAELEVAKQLRTLVPEEEFVEALTEVCEQLRAAVRGMRSRHAARMLHITTKVEAIHRLGVIEDELLANLRRPFESPDPSIPETTAA